MAGVANAGCKSDGGTTIALVPSWRETTPNASSMAAIEALDTLAPPLLTRLSPLDENAVALFEPRLIEDICLISKYEILSGDQDDGVLGRFDRLGRGGVKVLIAFNAPTLMGDVLFDR